MNPERAVSWVLRPGLLRGALVVLIIIAVGWACLIALTHLITRPKGLTTTKRAIGAGLVIALTFIVSAPLAVGARYTLSQLQLLGSITGDDVTAGSRPNIDTNAENPWKDTPRLNILLLGADSTDTRIKDAGGSYTPRTDTIMVASIDTTSGDTTLIQIPRNLKYTPFPEGSKLAQLFPRGFRGAGDEAEWYVNALWEKTVAGDHPDMVEALGTPTPTYPGAEVLKQGIEGITGLHMHYFVLLNINGLEQLINAMGGVRVNINQKLPIGGNETTGEKPSAWLQPGPDQLLDGYHAMWYARGRYHVKGADFDRMARQSCLVNAVIKQADPLTMLTRYEGIAQASSDMVMTDIPQEVLALVAQLAVKVKDASVSRLAFVDGQNGFVSANPDFTLTRTRVHDAITPPTHTSEPTTNTPTETPNTTKPSPTPTKQTSPEQPQPSDAPASTAEQVTNACAYNPQE